MWVKWILVCSILLGNVSNLSAHYYDNVTSLIAAVLVGYNTDVRPVINQSDTVHVNTSMIIYSLLEVNTVQETMTFVLSLMLSWYDERITWNASDYNGVSSFSLPKKYVWTPTLALTSPVQFETVGETWMHVTYMSNGYASWIPGGVFTVSCSMKMKYWPFDVQECRFGFADINYLDSELLLQQGSLITSAFKENGEWTLEESSINSDYSIGRRQIEFTFKLRRRTMFYAQTLIIPLVCLCFLSSFVFLLPSDSGERVGYCITILLSMTVFLDIISGDIPKLSNPPPAICLYLLIAVVGSSGVTIAVIFNLAVYHRSDKVPVGNHYKSFVRLTRLGKSKVNVQPEEPHNELEPHNKKSNTGIENGVTNTCDKEPYLNGTFMAHPKDKENKCDVNGNKIENDVIYWPDVSKAFDKVLFVITTLFAVVHVSAMLITLSQNA